MSNNRLSLLQEQIHQWHTSGLGLIDCRSKQDYLKSHIKGACHIEINRLADQMHRLPSSNYPIYICIDPDQMAAAKDFFNQKKYQVVAYLDWQQQIEPWLKAEQLFQQGDISATLWQPSDIVYYLEQQIQQQILSKQNFLPKQTITDNQVLDLACGAGRDSVYLAQLGLQVTGIDYKQDALDKLKALAEQHQQKVTGIQLDLENQTNPLQNQQLKQQYDLILVVRYLHRPLLNQLEKKLTKGGILAYQTFMQGCEIYGRPKNPAYLLKENELANQFNQMQVLQNKKIKLADDRPINLFVAKKILD